MPAVSTPRLDLLNGVELIEVSSSLRGAFAGRTLALLGASVTRWDYFGGERDAALTECDEHKKLEPYPVDGAERAARLGAAHGVIDDCGVGALAAACRSAGVPYVAVTDLGLTEAHPNPAPGLVDAESGIMWDLGRDGAPPLPLPGGVGATLAGIHAATALVWSLLSRTGDPAPQAVDIATADVVTAQVGTYHTFLRAYGGSWTPTVRPSRGSLGSSLALGALLDCTDGVALVYVTVPGQLARLHAMMPPGFAEKFPTYRDGLVKREDFVAELREWAAIRTRREVLDDAERHGVVCSPFLEMDDLDLGGILPLLRASISDQPSLPLPWLVVGAEVAGHVPGA